MSRSQNPVVMHINYCQQGQSLEDACRKAREWGFDGIEFNTSVEGLEPEAYLDRIAKAWKKEKLRVIHFGGRIQLSHSKAAQRDDALAGFFRFYELALQRFKLTICNLCTDDLVNESQHPYIHYEKHGSALATKEMFAQQVAGLKQIAAFAKKNGFRFAFETHHGYLHDLPEATMRLVKAVGSPALGVLFDYGNTMGFANAPSLEESIETVKDSLFYVHLKNSFSTGTRYRQRCALGEGEINHREFLRLLIELGYKGSFCLESPRQGDREFFAQQDIQYFRGLLAEGESI